MERLELARRLGGTPGGKAAATRPASRVVCAADPREFMSTFVEAVSERATGGQVFLADPHWGGPMRTQFAAEVGRSAVPHAAVGKTPADETGWLCIPTGGSGGALKLACHDQDTLAAATEGFCVHFGVGPVNAIGVLPLHHVSGLMAWMRCALTGGQFRPHSWPDLQEGDRPKVPGGDWFLSLVPTQLQRLLTQPEAVDWLRRFRAVFVGGGPTWPALLDAAAERRVPLALSYGMTETAAMVSALRPEEFAAGVRNCGAVLPHARVEIDPAGLVSVGGASLFRGYFPRPSEAPRRLTTQDAGAFDAQGRLQIFGRRDALIITGGEKVDPLLVEAVLRSTGQFADIAVFGMDDPHWGQVVVAAFPMDGLTPDWKKVASVTERDLAPPQRPKQFVPIVDWPRSPQGKIDLAALRRAVASGGGNLA